MPHSSVEENEGNRTTRRSLNIAAWWRKFHFSGRVIMCSVLLGLGLILIGGLIFAINIDDDDDSLNKESDGSVKVPTKAPSHYTGPVVMGIGGFIVVMGVTMCLFETQVCRKRTGDSSPLIPEKTDDPEKKASDPTEVPSTSNTHKCHKHGTRKCSASPKKYKSRHAKHHSKERSRDKSPSSKSPPIPVEPSKNFMTSSEENFLTPPNTLQENPDVVKNGESREFGDKHSSLMKSFTSSSPSWNQSTEFLTPSSSFIQTPVSVNNSVEIGKTPEDQSSEVSKNQNVNSEYVIPLTVEEDRIQQLLIRVKNEQKQQADSKMTTSLETSESSSSYKDFSSSPEPKSEDEASKAFEGEIKSTNIVTSEMHHDNAGSKVVSQEQRDETEKSHEVKHESNEKEKCLEGVNNEVVTKITEEITNAVEEKSLSQHTSQQGENSSEINLTPAVDEVKDLASCVHKAASFEKAEKKDEQIDFESSVSSDETVVSPDNPKEIFVRDETAVLTTSKEDSSDDSKKVTSTESPANETSTENCADADHRNIETDAGETREHDTILSENNIVEEQINNTDHASTLESS